MIFCKQDMELQLEQAKSELQLQSTLASGLQDSQVCLYFNIFHMMVMHNCILGRYWIRTDKFVAGVYTGVILKNPDYILYGILEFLNQYLMFNKME